MTRHEALDLAQSVGVSVSAAPAGLRAIQEPGCSAAIWSRTPEPALQRWLDSLAPAHLPRARLILPSDEIREATTQVMKAQGLPECAAWAMFIDDVVAPAALFSEIMDSPLLRLRLDVITTNACRKFHIDAVKARLICTYRGHATQYGNGAVGEEPVEVHDLPTGAPMILRGTQWPSGAAPGLLHRSPPIEGTGETRLVLVLDPIAADHDMEDEAQPH